MATVKFDKAVRYHRVRYPAHVVFEVADSDVEALRKQGATVMSAPVAEPEDKKKVSAETGESEESAESETLQFPTDEELLGYKLDDLVEFARERNINLHGATRKAEIFQIIVDARE